MENDSRLFKRDIECKFWRKNWNQSIFSINWSLHLSHKNILKFINSELWNSAKNFLLEISNVCYQRFVINEWRFGMEFFTNLKIDWQSPLLYFSKCYFNTDLFQLPHRYGDVKSCTRQVVSRLVHFLLTLW